VTLLEQFASLLAQVVVNPELPICQLSLVTNAARAALPDPKEALDDSWKGAIHELLAEQARRSPAKLAIVDPEQSWTYADLDRCANQLANGLIASGIQPSDLIAIYAHRSSSLIVALFGILKAGAAFLILDPAYPAARSVDCLRIAQPKGWLQLEGSSEAPDELLRCLDRLQVRCRVNVPQLKAKILDNLSAFADTEPIPIVTANNPAYVAFTSGSTGEPKGIICRHGPITHFLPWQKDAFRLSESDRFAMLSGLAYSHLHRDVFTALYVGATLYIPTPSEARSPEYLIHWLERNAITVLHLTPALGQLLLTIGGARLPSVQRVFFGGDVLTTEMVGSIRRLTPNATIGSFYGSTETQRAVGYFEIANDPTARGVEDHKSIPLGRGIKDVQLLVLNSAQQLSGVGELGEIFVRSPHLAEGYIGDEARTEQMFIVNPFTKDPQDRLYRTGELGRYLPDGNVEWAGRNDRRVNIRGFRVELEEIESALKQHPTVKDAAVVMREVELPDSETPNSKGFDNPKSKIQNPKLVACLVAYVAADEEPRSLTDLLQSYLSMRLPHYMLPAYFIVLPSLPLSLNGKVDYRSLPAMQFSGSVGTSTSPRDEVENKLCEIFVKLLGCSEVGIEENFFRIGGHSLLAARAAARIGDAFGVNLDLSTFLENPTVIGLARKVDSLRGTGQTTTESDKDQREEFNL
jgi:amino acid adenylation domain-containing protein